MLPLREPHTDSGVHAAKKWFLDNGVPHFLEHYHTEDRWRQLVPPMIFLVAFEVGMAVWHTPTLLQLLTAPPLILAYFAYWRWALRDTAPVGRHIRPRYVRLYAISAVIGGGLGLLLLVYFDRVGIDVQLNNETVDFLTILLLLLASLALTGAGASTASLRTAQLLVWCLAAAVLLFAAEGTVLPPLRDVVQTALGTEAFLPLALPCLVVVLPLSYACLRVGRASPTDPAGYTDGAAMIMPAAPLLLILLAAETATLPHTALEPWSSVVVLVAAGLLVAWATGRARRRCDDEGREEQVLIGAGIYAVILLTVALLAYPVIVGFDGRLSLTTTHAPVEGWAAFGIAALVHVGYVVATLVVVNFGLDRLAVWGAREASKNVTHLGNGLAEGLPLLLVFVTFFTFSGETWQIAYLTSSKAYVGLLAVLGLAVVLVLLWTAAQRVPRNPRYPTSDLVTYADKAARGEPELRAMVENWKQQVADTEKQEIRLEGRTRLNAVAVFAMYEALVLVPLACLTAGLLFLICKLAVRPTLAAGWIFGDGQEARGVVWRDDVLPGPWVRVAVVLAVFALLYVAVTMHRDDSENSRFFAGASKAVTQRLAMYAVYRSALAASDDSPDATARAAGEQPEDAATEDAEEDAAATLTSAP